MTKLLNMPPTSSFCHRKVYIPIIPSCNRHWNSPNDDEFSKNKTIFCLWRRIIVQSLNRIWNVWQISFAFNRRKKPFSISFRWFYDLLQFLSQMTEWAIIIRQNVTFGTKLYISSLSYASRRYWKIHNKYPSNVQM